MNNSDSVIIVHPIDTEFMTCLNCGYPDGFHSYFQRINSDTIKVFYKCPECSQRYDIGLTHTLNR